MPKVYILKYYPIEFQNKYFVVILIENIRNAKFLVQNDNVWQETIYNLPVFN